MRRYAGIVLVHGAAKLVLNVYRGWAGENAIRVLRWHILAYLRIGRIAVPGPQPRGVGTAMLVGEVEPVGGINRNAVTLPRHYSNGPSSSNQLTAGVARRI